MLKRPTLTRNVKDHVTNPFQLDDLLIFDKASFRRNINGCLQKISMQEFAWGMHTASTPLLERLLDCLPRQERSTFMREWQRHIPQCAIERTRHLLLNFFFWELTYWQTPQLYEELTIGERLPPEIFQQLEPFLREKVVLDAGAGSGRATFEALQHGARLIYAVEPSPGLFHILQSKVTSLADDKTIIPQQGDFAHLPLADQSVDIALACSSFTSEVGQGGEAGLAELKRVTRSNGSIVLIWPRCKDLHWLQEHGFRFGARPNTNQMYVHFLSPASARRCVRRFYPDNRAVLAYMLHHRSSATLPFSILGLTPPYNYCWLPVD